MTWEQTDSLRYRRTAHSGILYRHSFLLCGLGWSTSIQVCSIVTLQPSCGFCIWFVPFGEQLKPVCSAQTNFLTRCPTIPSSDLPFPCRCRQLLLQTPPPPPTDTLLSKTGVEQQLIFQERLFLKLLQNGPTHQGRHTTLSEDCQ